MSQLLPLLFALACPLGMVAMMAGPVLARRLSRRSGSTEANRSPGTPLAGSDVADGAPSGGGR